MVMAGVVPGQPCICSLVEDAGGWMGGFKKLTIGVDWGDVRERGVGGRLPMGSDGSCVAVEEPAIKVSGIELEWGRT